MKIKSINLLLFILIPIISIGQPSNKINKYSVGMAIDWGHSLTTLGNEQDRWKTKYNPAAAMNVLFVNRLNQKWIADLTIGFTAYGLILRGPIDKYVLDFASPHIAPGISYNFQNRKGHENFIKLSGGFQLGYDRTFVDEFETYTITIKGKNKFYQFIKPEIGIRKYFKKRMDGSRYKMAYEIGAYFRYNINTLGTATIEEDDFEVTLEPRGNMLGGYFKILMPAGRKRIKMKPANEKILPPIIYNPRDLK